MPETVIVYVRTNKVGSDVSVDTRVSEGEWDKMREEEKAEIIMECANGAIEVWTSRE